MSNSVWTNREYARLICCFLVSTMEDINGKVPSNRGLAKEINKAGVEPLGACSSRFSNYACYLGAEYTEAALEHKIRVMRSTDPFFLGKKLTHQDRHRVYANFKNECPPAELLNGVNPSEQYELESFLIAVRWMLAWVEDEKWLRLLLTHVLIGLPLDGTDA